MPHVKSAPGAGRVPLDGGIDVFENSFLNVDISLPLAAAAVAAGKIIVLDAAAPPRAGSNYVGLAAAMALVL